MRESLVMFAGNVLTVKFDREESYPAERVSGAKFQAFPFSSLF